MVAVDGVACVMVGGDAGRRAGPTSRSGIMANWWTGDLITLPLWRPVTSSPTTTIPSGLKLTSFAIFGAFVVADCWCCIFCELLLPPNKLFLLFFCDSAWIKWCEPFNFPLATFAVFVGFALNAADDGSKSVPASEAFKGLVNGEGKEENEIKSELFRAMRYSSVSANRDYCANWIWIFSSLRGFKSSAAVLFGAPITAPND